MTREDHVLDAMRYVMMTVCRPVKRRAENGLPSSGEIQPCCGKAHPMNINGQDIADHKPMEEV